MCLSMKMQSIKQILPVIASNGEHSRLDTTLNYFTETFFHVSSHVQVADLTTMIPILTADIKPPKNYS